MLSKPELSGRSAIIPVVDVITQAAVAIAADRRPGQAAPGLEDGPRLTVAASSGAPAQHADAIAEPATEPMIQPAAERAEGNAVSWTVDIILAYLARNAVDSQALPKLIADLHGVLEQISTPEQRAPETGPRPAVPVGLSVTPDYIVCLEDGRRFKSMKRYLKSAYSLTPEEYREKWGLPASYPMIAPGYAALCSARAKSQKLGRRSAG